MKPSMDAARSRCRLAQRKPGHGPTVVRGGYAITASPPRLEATARAFAGFLRERDLSRTLAAHRDRFAAWLAQAGAT